jgi:cytochrome c
MLKPKPTLLSAAALVITLSLSGGALGADGASLFMSKTCWSCHGKDANSPIMPVYPKLAGQNADYAFNQMKDIKSGARSNGQAAAMKGVMGLVSDEEMRAIADWLATLK